jgi:hypothetical protein
LGTTGRKWSFGLQLETTEIPVKFDLPCNSRLPESDEKIQQQLLVTIHD